LETALVGRRSARAYKIADLMPVRVIAIDEARGRVDLTLADSEDDKSLDPGDDGSRDLASASSGASSSGDASRGRRSGSRKPKTTRTRAPGAARPPQGRGRGRR